MTDDDQQDETTPVPDDETPEDRDQGQRDSRLSTDRDDPEDGDAEDDSPEADPEADDPEDGDTFPRHYVERLRARSAGYRTRATTAEARTAELERALFTERVRALDVLADPADLPFDADMLDDPDALSEAVAALVRARPHYRRRGTAAPGDTGSRDRAARGDGVSLTGIMRGHG